MLIHPILPLSFPLLVSLKKIYTYSIPFSSLIPKIRREKEREKKTSFSHTRTTPILSLPPPQVHTCLHQYTKSCTKWNIPSTNTRRQTIFPIEVQSKCIHEFSVKQCDSNNTSPDRFIPFLARGNQLVKSNGKAIPDFFVREKRKGSTRVIGTSTKVHLRSHYPYGFVPCYFRFVVVHP